MSTEEKRRLPRIPLDQLHTEMEFHGVTIPVRVADLSENGVRLVLGSQVPIQRNEEIRIAMGKISPNVRARVRWVSPSSEQTGEVQLGVEFESFLLESPQEDEIQDLLEAWREISNTYSVFESFLHILELLDQEIVDGKIDVISEAIYSILVWLDQRMGPLNLWSVIREADGTPSSQLTLERHPAPPEEREARRLRVAQVAEKGITQWFEGHPYLYGETVVLEYLGDNESQIDLLQKLTVLLGRRVQFWSKLLMKNIAIQLLGDELERVQVGRGRV